jgi:branched-chain amino acid transport system substrate-binding protein
MKKSVFFLLGLVVVFATACGTSGTSAPPAKDAPSNAGATIKIGGVFSASGGASSLGKPEMDTLKMMVEKTNADGGINGHQLELIAYDDKSDQNEAVLDTKKLIEQDKVVAIIGGTTSGNSLAMIPLAEKSKIPFISIAASKNINKPTKKYVFKTAQGDDVVVPAVIDYLKNHQLTKVAWLSVDNSFGSSGKEEFGASSKQAGIDTVISETFEATVNDAKPMLTRVKNANPQAIVIWGTTQECAVVTKNVRELGISVPIIESHGIASKQFIDLAGKAANGVILPAGRLLVEDQLPDSNKQKKILHDYATAFKGKFNYAPSTFGGHAWDAFEILSSALKTAGNDSGKVRDAIESGTKDFVGISGIFNISADNHNGLGADALTIVEIQDGNWKLKK